MGMFYSTKLLLYKILFVKASRDAILSAIDDYYIAVDISYEKDLLKLKHRYQRHFYNPLQQLRNIVLICEAKTNET